MADFRRWILAFVVLALALGCVVPASAQSNTFTCSATASVPPNIRHEGLTELLGDIVLTCTGGLTTPTGQPIPQANITVYLPAPFTSRIVPSNTTSTEALLLVDDPAGSQVKVCPTPTNGLTCVDTGDNGASFATNGGYNAFQGIIPPQPGGTTTPPMAVTFLGVPVDPPTSSGAPARVYRITNVRINASLLPSQSLGVYPVQALVSVSSSTSISINNSQQTVGYATPGLAVNPTGTAKTLLLCQSYGSASDPFSPYSVGTATFTENFTSAFKKRTEAVQVTPGTVYAEATESGLEVAGVPAADFGTRLMATISNIPSNVSVYVDSSATYNATTGAGCTPDGTADCSYAVLVSGPTATDSGANGYPAYAPNVITDVTDSISGGTLQVVWEVGDNNPQAYDTFSFGIYVVTTAGNLSTTATPVTVSESFAPLSSVVSATGGGWTGVIPSFSSSITPNSATLFTVQPCVTYLLFPYITDYPGFDTGIAISNTSADPLGTITSSNTSTQTGACTVNFYGGYSDSSGFTNNATNLGTTGAYSSVDANFNGTGMIAPGQTWTFGVSAIDSQWGTTGYNGVTGYAIATCNFQFAHGYSFVSDYGLRNFAAAYLALVIPQGTRTPEAFDCLGGSTCSGLGEQLVH